MTQAPKSNSLNAKLAQLQADTATEDALRDIATPDQSEIINVSTDDSEALDDNWQDNPLLREFVHHVQGSVTLALPLSVDQRKALKAKAHHLDPLVRLNSTRFGANHLIELERTLAAHELIKIKVFGDDHDFKSCLAHAICHHLKAGLVQLIGKLIIIYRPKPASAAQAQTTTPQKRTRTVKVTALNEVPTMRAKAKLLSSQERGKDFKKKIKRATKTPRS
jgi:putative YhbY family RNA-binding protein